MILNNSITQLVAQHPQQILLWTNGFFCALALKRGRIEALFDKVLPTSGDKENEE